jgi:hypothetical protein
MAISGDTGSSLVRLASSKLLLMAVGSPAVTAVSKTSVIAVPYPTYSWAKLGALALLSDSWMPAAHTIFAITAIMYFNRGMEVLPGDASRAGFLLTFLN